MGKAQGFYAVAKGRQMGIYSSWAECEANVKGFPDAKFKKFPSREEAQSFIDQWSAGRPAGGLLKASAKPNRKLGEAQPSAFSSSATRRSSLRAEPSKLVVPSHASSETRLQSIIASSKRRHENDDQAGTQLLDSPISRLTNATKRLRTESPQVKKGVKSLDGESVYLPFIVDDDEYVNVYTDGACTNNGHSNPKAGVGVWFGDDHPLNISKPVDGPPTNNTAEIQAARLAIEVATQAGFEKLKVNTDSAFLINCVTQWLPKWKRNGWKLTTGGDVKNRIELEKLDLAMKNISVQWTKVPAHSGVHGNEMADKLASDGALRY